MSFLFEVIASRMILDTPWWFDGAIDLISRIRKSRQIVFKGKMWMADHKTQWLEVFEAVVTDKRISKQGIWVKIQVGEYVAEGDLLEIL